MKPNRYDLILLFAVVSGIYYVIDETLNNAPPRRPAETLPVVFSVDASPQTAAGLVQGLIKNNQWCHVPVGARQAWDFALVDTELAGEAATAVYRLDGAPAWDVVYAPKNDSACFRYASGACLSNYYRAVQCTNQISRRVPLLNVTSTPSTRRDAGTVKVHHGIKNMKHACCRACAKDPTCQASTVKPASHERLLSASTEHKQCDKGSYSSLVQNVTRLEYNDFYRETRRRLQEWDPEQAFVIQNNVQRFAEHVPTAFAPLEGYKIACSDFHLRALRCIARGEACHPCLTGDWALVVEEDTRFNGTEQELPSLLLSALETVTREDPTINKIHLHGHPRLSDAYETTVQEMPWEIRGFPDAVFRRVNVYLDSHAYLIKRSHARAIVEAHDVLVNGSTACRNPWYDADVEANTCSLDPSLLYGAFRACTLPGTSCAGLALGTKSSHNLVVHGSGGKDNADHRQEKRLNIRTQHAPDPLKRFRSVGELRKWAHAGGAAAWRRGERLKQARWQLEVDEYRVAHGLVGDVE